MTPDPALNGTTMVELDLSDTLDLNFLAETQGLLLFSLIGGGGDSHLCL